MQKKRNNKRTGKNLNFQKARNPGQEGPKGREPVSVIGMRLNKYVAHCGVCSRRAAAELVKRGKIQVNDKVVLEPFYQIQEGDVVKHEDKVIEPQTRQVYVLLNKPKNTITTLNDEKGRKTVMDLLEGKIEERIFPVGRLDRDTTGLLLLTNDGTLGKKLTHPSHKVSKIYEVTLDKPVTQDHFDQIKAGLELEDGPAPVKQLHYLSEKAFEKNLVSIEIQIGRNRIVRRIFESLGYEVKKLDRTYVAGLTKKDLPRGRWRFLSEREIIMLRHFV
ncbi:MAG: pseudouridine synthase [Saprospiraceae bacterium]